jgi:hypothetical protein
MIDTSTSHQPKNMFDPQHRSPFLEDKFRKVQWCHKQVEFIEATGPNNSFLIGSNPDLHIGINYLLLGTLARLFPSQLYSTVRYLQNCPITPTEWYPCINRWDFSNSVLKKLKSPYLTSGDNPNSLMMPILEPTNFHVEQVWKATGGRARTIDITVDVGDILLTSWKICYSTAQPSLDRHGLYNKALRINIATAMDPTFLPSGTTTNKDTGAERMKKTIYRKRIQQLYLPHSSKKQKE